MQLPLSVEGCLPQSVKDLGVGAKRAPGTLSWAVGPEKLHAALVGKGAVTIVADRGSEAFHIGAVAEWTGELGAESRAELERRLQDLTGRIAFFCGHAMAKVACVSGAKGGVIPCEEAR